MTAFARAGVIATRRVLYVPRVVTGIAGALASPSWAGMPANVTRLAAGTHNNYDVAADTLVLPQIGDEGDVTLTGETNIGAGGALYGVTLDPNGAGWSAFLDNDDSEVRQCTFINNPTIEHVRVVDALGCAVIGNRFEGSPTNHACKVYGQTAPASATVGDNTFAGTPTEDHVQTEDTNGCLIEHNEFTGLASEDAVDLKWMRSGQITIARNMQFTSAGSSAEGLVDHSNTPGGGYVEMFFLRFVGMFCSIGSDDELDTPYPLHHILRNSVFESGSTLRLRRSTDTEVHNNKITDTQVDCGTSTASDFPVDAELHHNHFHNLTVNAPNGSATINTHDNTYTGSTTGAFPGPDGGND
jgi:hypothetical protein